MVISISKKLKSLFTKIEGRRRTSSPVNEFEINGMHGWIMMIMKTFGRAEKERQN